ncbi:hypothetical protein IJD34_07175 [bacterium]|nr:hypothetical protein [bacterium]
MRIQSINNNYNQNNISHKAHFKVNRNFERLYGEQIKTADFQHMVKLFKETLPKHEIEITKLREVPFSKMIGCEFINNTTKQVYDTIIPCRTEGITYLTALIGLMKDHPFFKGADNTEYDCYNDLTKE